MAQITDPQHSVRSVRRRLFGLLMRAFATVVLLTVVLLIVLIGVFINSGQHGNQAMALVLGQALRAFYVGRGGWAGVEAMLDDVAPAAWPNAEHELRLVGWKHTLLLDESNRVLIDSGRTDTPLVGQVYAVGERDWTFPLHVGGAQVGTLVAQKRVVPLQVPLVVGLLFPIGVISFFTGLLTLLIGWLLARRVVTPLADVIAAAHSVAAGDLSTRVQVRGPGDLRGLSDSFNRMAGALERSDRERRELLTDIAHELRTPLTVIRGRLEGIVDGVYPADEAHVAPVLEETYLLERLVEDLRLLTLAESRQLRLDLAEVDLGQLAARAADLFEAEAAENRIALSVLVEPDLPPVMADAQRVGQVLGNLLSNALRYAPAAHGRVEIAVRRAGPAGAVELAVSDNGPGVPEADLARLFDRFWRADRSRSRSAGGAGLGLAVARQLVEAHGGSVAAVNLPGGGLKVSAVLE